MTTAKLDDVKQIDMLKDRIRSAKMTSKIALFKTMREGQFVIDAVFAGTYITKKRIREGDENYIGSYFGESQVDEAIAAASEFLMR
jgi:hypothetical protein